MRVQYRHVFPEHRTDSLVIILPGALQQPDDLVDAGFVEMVRAHDVPLDVALVDLQLDFVGDAIDNHSLRRLHEDVIVPATLQGYGEIWLAGISIGGFLSLAYASRHPGNITGLCLIALYPGNRLLTNEIRAAGGVRTWAAGNEEDDLERCTWHWLQSRPAPSPDIYFGYGLQDRFASGQQLMASAVPDAQVDAIDGTHDWPAWRQLWGNFLDWFGARLQQNNKKDAA